MLALYVSNVSHFLGVNVAIAPQWQHQKNVFVVLKFIVNIPVYSYAHFTEKCTYWIKCWNMITYSFIGSLSSKGPTFSKNSYMLTYPMCIFFHVMLALYVSNVSYFLGVNVAIAPQWQHQKNVFVVLKCPQFTPRCYQRTCSVLQGKKRNRYGANVNERTSHLRIDWLIKNRHIDGPQSQH
jgi:hypothetical protein